MRPQGSDDKRPPALRPSEIRQRLLNQHRWIAELAAGVEQAAKHVLAGATDAEQSFTYSVRELEAAVQSHNDFEERVLAPLLQRVDAWGPERVGMMVKKHAQEHTSVTRALEASQSPRLDLLARARVASAAIAELLDHMAREEREILHVNLLRDDIVTVDQSGG